MMTIWSMNHGSMPVASNTSAIVAPARNACCTVTMRPSVGTDATASSSSLVRVSVPQWKLEPRFSSDRRAFCSALV